MKKTNIVVLIACVVAISAMSAADASARDASTYGSPAAKSISHPDRVAQFVGQAGSGFISPRFALERRNTNAYDANAQYRGQSRFSRIRRPFGKDASEFGSPSGKRVLRDW